MIHSRYCRTSAAQLLLLVVFTLCTIAISAQTIYLNEMMSQNDSGPFDEDGDTPDWIELYNAGPGAAQLEGYGLKDGSGAEQSWIIPTLIIEEDAHLLIFCSDKDRTEGPYLHTDFKLSGTGEPVVLLDPQGVEVDRIPTVALSDDFSYARSEDGLGTWQRTQNATPAQSNALGGMLDFSHGSGHYSDPLMLDITHSQGHDVRYTLDGSEPDEDDPLFVSPIAIDGAVGALSNISSIPTSPYWQAPTGGVQTTHVLRARSFMDGEPTSMSYSRTYFIGDDILQSYEGYPIISIQMDSLSLFDHETGIYVPGVNFNPSNVQWTGNYFQKGIEWERSAHFEYFEDGELQWEQGAGVRINGGKTRNAPQKSLRVYARKETGAHRFNHQFFDTKEKTVFDKLLLRGHYGGWNRGMIKDGLTAYVARDLDFESQHSKLVVIFLNGEYWGLSAIRDYYDSNYIEEEYDIEKDSVNILLHGSGTRDDQPDEWGIVEGDNDYYRAAIDFIEDNPLDDPANYQYITTQIDMSSMIEYYCTEIYFNNYDWPSNNHKVWNGGADTKWRWMLYDFDSGWGYKPVSTNTLVYASHPTGSSVFNTPYTTFLFRSLLESDEFVEQFLSTYACLMNTTFHSDTVESAIDRFVEIYSPGVSENAARWHNVSSETSWLSVVNSRMYSFNDQRRQYAISHVSSYFDIDFDPDGYDCDPIVCPADLNSDLVVDINDFLILNSFFGEACEDCPADINSTDVVDVNDFVDFNSAFNEPCE